MQKFSITNVSSYTFGQKSQHKIYFLNDSGPWFKYFRSNLDEYYDSKNIKGGGVSQKSHFDKIKFLESELIQFGYTKKTVSVIFKRGQIESS